MKTLRTAFAYLLPVLLLFISSCDQSSFYFDGPMPPKASNLKAFPQSAYGQYTMQPNEHPYLLDYKLQISSLGVTATGYITDTVSLDEAENDSTVFIEENKAFYVENGDSIPFEYKLYGDSIIVKLKSLDTLFCFAKGDKLRKFKRDYFLNIMNDSTWEVRKMKFKKIDLLISYQDTNCLRVLEKIDPYFIEVSGEKVFHLEQKQFKKYCRKGGFDRAHYFAKE